MGVSGVGKSTVGKLLAERLGWPFRDADSFHPPANIAKMSAGTPLDDEDRKPWLAAIAAWLDERRAGSGHGVVTCSALKRTYRDVLLAGRPDVRLIFLHGPRDLIDARMAARKDHFMPPALLDSQLATLEPPTPDEGPVAVEVRGTPAEIAARALHILGA
jgi:carbohydrate kinase (thermoresistant glucokinase family)